MKRLLTLSHLLMLCVMSANVVVGQSAAHDRAQLRVTVKDVNPWTHLRLNNNPQNFQFAIVADRTGGHRPGVFLNAVHKLNLLQPEFVMSVGDLIEGYTEDRETLRAEWDEFVGIVDALEMPFFYVVGNHEITNPVTAQVWSERFGAPYYHFVYRDVLFLSLNTEDGGPSSISEAQQAYVANALGQTPDARWTFVFMHEPLWLYTDKETGDLRDTGWPEVETMLKDRPHTVFAGHYHNYTKHERNNQNYFVLATTGAARLEGERLSGNFDHVVWVTVTDQGPRLANLMLDGIWDEDIRTAQTAPLVDPLLEGRAITIAPMFSETRMFEGGETTLQLTNDADVPLNISATFPAHPAVAVHPSAVTVVVPPQSREVVDLHVTAQASMWPVEELPPVVLKWSAEYEQQEVELPVIEGETRPLVTRARFLTALRNAEDQWPSFSPDGEQVVLLRWVYGTPAEKLFVVPTSGGKAKPLSNAPELEGISTLGTRWSPDGTRIAFVGVYRDDSGKRVRSVWVVNADGSGTPTELVRSALSDNVLWPSWYPDGKHLAALDGSTGALVRIRVEDGDVVPLTDPDLVLAGYPSVSPNGDWIAFAGQANDGQEYSASNNSIWLVPNSTTQLPAPEEYVEVSPGNGHAPAWSPDGKWLAFFSNRGSSNSTSYSVYIINRDGTGLRRITSPLLDARQPKWSPDGKRLVFTAELNRARGIAVIDVER